MCEGGLEYMLILCLSSIVNHIWVDFCDPLLRKRFFT
jgi:hypothetical protein